MESCYSCRQPLLLLSEDSFHSCCGVQQGDPLGPMGFAFAFQSLIEHMQADFPGSCLKVWYLDNGILVGSPADLAAALKSVEQEGLTLGLHFNLSKFFFYIIPDDAYPSDTF